jgi:flagella basal body P-ring formation protein FlgA
MHRSLNPVAAAALSLWGMAPAIAAERAVASSGSSLAEAAESFAEDVLSLPSGSVRAQSIDRKLQIGECATGWAWGFAFGSRQTVQVVCPGDPRSRRLVALALPESAAPDPEPRNAATVVVVVRDLPFGHRLGAADLREETAATGARLTGTVSSMESALGQTLTRTVRSGETLARADLRTAISVKRNTMVMGWSEFAGGRVSAKLTALENGRVGQWIDLENPQSGRKLRAEVQADGSVRLGAAGSSGPTTAVNNVKVSPTTAD